MLVLVLNSGSAAYVWLCVSNKCSKQVSKSQMLCLWFHIHLQLFFFSIYFYKTTYLMNIIILHCNHIIVLLYYFIIVLLYYCVIVLYSPFLTKIGESSSNLSLGRGSLSKVSYFKILLREYVWIVFLMS